MCSKIIHCRAMHRYMHTLFTTNSTTYYNILPPATTLLKHVFGIHLILLCHLPLHVCAAYRDRLLMPKMQTTTAGDEMFILDNSFFYWDFLSGPKFLRYEFLAQGHIQYIFNIECYLSVHHVPCTLGQIVPCSTVQS